MKIKWTIVLFSLSVMFFSGLSIQQVKANEVDLILIPDEQYLFNIANMKPGDWAEKKLTIKNGGDNDIKYSFKVNSMQTDNKLFNELELKVYSGSTNNLVFEDKLKNFKGFSPQLLKKNESDNLIFVVKIPYELGNEYQNTSALFEITINAESYVPSKPSGGTDTKTPDSDRAELEKSTISSKPLLTQGLNLPKTATKIYKLLFLGVIFTGTGLLLIYLNKIKRKKNETY
ncbi:TasA family protein [Rossellomorea vietnamensis]|uniref:TasA family protein n=1 Tax=Rossellomorea vietnamensis TaxID=218284 RepID=UPI003D2BEB05